MKTQIKTIGTSKGVIFSKEFLKYMELELGDWVDISDIVKVKRERRCNMNAQEIIDNSNLTDHLSLFYPSIAKQKQADKNITKILMEVK